MSRMGERPDELQQIWQEDDSPIEKEKRSMLMSAVQEKRQSYFELIDNELQRHYKRALLVAPVAVYFAWRAPLLPARIGWIVVAIVSLCFAAEVIWRNRGKAVPVPEQDARTYCRELVGLLDQRIRTVERSHWYSLPPMVLIVVLVVLPYLGPWGSVFLGIGTMLLWLLMRRQGREVVEDLRRRKQEVVELLKEMDSV